MQIKRLANTLLTGMALLAFLSQTMVANASHNIHIPADNTNVNHQPSASGMGHHAHMHQSPMQEVALTHQNHQQPAHAHHLPPPSKIDDCCDDQCQCIAAQCSMLYAMINQVVFPSVSFSLPETQLITAFPSYYSSTLLRPPIYSYV